MFENLFKTYELTRAAIVLAVVLGLIYVFVGGITTIDGPSMEPTLQNGSTGLVDKASYYFTEPQKGDVVDLRFPGDPDKTHYVKRIIAIPGQQVRIRNDQIFIDNEPYNDAGTLPYIVEEGLWQLQDDEYFVVGDNLSNSTDSRTFGAVERRFIVGKLHYIVWPPSAATDL